MMRYRNLCVSAGGEDNRYIGCVGVCIVFVLGQKEETTPHHTSEITAQAHFVAEAHGDAESVLRSWIRTI